MSANDDLIAAVDDRSQKRILVALENGASLETKNDNEETPLMAVLRSKSGVMSKTEETIALWLLEEGADVHTKNDYGEGPLHLAAANGSKTLVRALAERGAKITTNEDGGTPLHGCIETTTKTRNCGSFSSSSAVVWKIVLMEKRC